MGITLKTIKRLIARDVPVIVEPTIATVVEEYLTQNPPSGYTHPSTHPATMITGDSTHRFTTDIEKNTWDNKVADNDPRLGDSRPASDVYTWAKATTKPTYNNTEVGAEAANANIQNHVTSAHIQFSGLSKITVSVSQPSNPSTGDIWIQTT